MFLAEIVETSTAVAATSSRSAKIALLAAVLRRLAPDEAAIGVAYLSSQLRQRQIGVGYASIRDLPEPADTSTLSLIDVDAALETIGQLAGRDSQSERRRHLTALFGRATKTEQELLVRP